MSQRGRRAIKGILIGLVLIALVVGYYFYLSNRKPKEAAEDTETTVSAVQKLLLKNIDDDYPPTPREVLKLYSDITVCFYSEDYTDEELTQLALQIEKLYDEELIANNTPDQYQKNLRWDIKTMKDKNLRVTSYSVASATDVDYFDAGGRNWARLSCTYTIRSGKEAGLAREIFLLRKDDMGHWKIYGWEAAKER
ncbi:MAG TPA: hypothetical protein DFI63_11925 [Lachnospiraceae bacterium]|jgi:hypothetical protein|nr:hypothetical protein [Lachnospiraceae bacterium]